MHPNAIAAIKNQYRDACHRLNIEAEWLHAEPTADRGDYLKAKASADAIQAHAERMGVTP